MHKHDLTVEEWSNSPQGTWILFQLYWKNPDLTPEDTKRMGVEGLLTLAREQGIPVSK